MGRSVSVARHATVWAFSDVSDFDEDYGWQFFVECIQERAQELWGSFYPCDKWLGREDHAILENSFAYIGVSEYCGLASVWLVCKADEDYYLDEEGKGGIARNWCNMISEKFKREFGDLDRVAVMSNGEGVYERRA